MRLHLKSFFPARRDPSSVLLESYLNRTKFSHVITSARYSGMKKLLNISVLKITRGAFQQIKAISIVFTVQMTSIYEKKSYQISLQNFIILQKHPPEVFCKKGVLKNFSTFTGKHLFLSLFAGLQVLNFIKKRHQHLCFPMNIAKRLKTPILNNLVNKQTTKGTMKMSKQTTAYFMKNNRHS